MRTEPEPDWHEDAACATTDPDLFFPEGYKASLRPAINICRDCPARLACLEDSLKWPASEQFGVVGGLAAHERKALIRRRNRNAA